MLGAIVGDIVGSRFEFNNWQGGKGFKLFNDHYSSITDDTICTVAIADAILSRTSYKESLLKWCRKYPQPMGGYGVSFAAWLRSEDPQPYYSFGNGAAMRVSPVAWAFADRNEVLREAERTASVSHDHPEGIKGAQAVAYAIWYIRQFGFGKEQRELLFKYIAKDFYPGWQRKEYPAGVFDESCQGTVPVAFQIIKRSYSFEDAIREAICWGGDSDTLGAIVGSIAEAIWGVPVEIANKALVYLPEEMRNVLELFQYEYQNRFNI